MDPLVEKKIIQFEAYINETLRGDLAQFEKKLDSKNTDIAEYVQLKTIINTLKTINVDKGGFKTKVDMGNSIFIQAHVEDASNILLDVGLGHFVEFTLDEALVIINIRTKLLERQIEHLRKQIFMTNAHIKILLLGIHDLQELS